MNEYLILGLIYTVAATVQGFTGFGFAVISVPLVAMIYDPATAVTMNLVVGTVSFAYKAYLLRDRTDWRRVGAFYGVSVLFIPLGVLAVTMLPRTTVLVVMGFFVGLVGVLNVRAAGIVARTLATRWAYWFFAALAGALAGGFSAPGPAAVPYLLTRERDPIVGQANLQWFFVFVSPVVIGLYLVTGSVGIDALVRAAYFVPLVFVIILGCNAMTLRTSAAVLRTAVNIALVGMGALLVLTNLW